MKKTTALFLALIILITLAAFPAAAQETQKIPLTTGNITITRTFDSGWQGPANFYNPENLVDGSTATYSNWDQYPEVGTTADMRCDVVIDLKAVKNISEVVVHTGVESNVGATWIDHAPPMNAEILVAGEDGVYTSVFTYDSDSLEAARTDSVTLDPVTNGANIRYIKYTFNKVARHTTISEIEVYEAVTPEPTEIVPLGANIRLPSDDTTAGLRFAAKIDKAVAGVTEQFWSEDSDPEVKFGMFLIPDNLIGEYETLADYLEAGCEEALDVPAKNIYAYDDETITYTAVLVGIPEKEYIREIIAVPYMLKDGEYTYFAEQQNSFLGVAEAALDSYNNGNPNGITPEQVTALREIIEIGEAMKPDYYDIDLAASKQGLAYTNAYLPASLFVNLGTSYAGYKIDGTYKVDEATLRMLTTVDCIGNGKVKWVNFQDCGSWSGNLEQPEYAPVDLLKDPIYMSMILPSERRCFLETRTNGSFLDVAEDKWVNIMTIGAVYRNLDVEIPDDAEFTLCISDVNLAVRTTKSNGWYEAINLKVPTVYNHMYYLPWQLGGTLELKNRITYFSDHVEIKLTGADFNATEAKKISSQVQQCVYHFWGQMHYFDCKGSEVLGVASSFKMWVKEPEARDYLVVGIGADWRDANGGILQAFAGAKYAVTNEPKVILGHNVELSRYRDVMDSEKVQEILGLR